MIRTLALLLPLLVLPVLARGGPEPAHLEDATLANVLYVRAGDSSGTGFLLTHGETRYIVTAHHVVDGWLADDTMPLEFHVGGERGRAIKGVELFRKSARADIAVFTFEEDAVMPYFESGAGLVPQQEAHLASQVFLVGYPAVLRQTFGASALRVVGGWVAGLKKYVPGSTVEYMDIDMPGVEHGHSGGPILILQNEVVAVAVQRRTGSVSDSIGATYAVPIKYVTALIDDRPVDEDVNALNEVLRDTALVAGLAVQGKGDYDVWIQRVQRRSGDAAWGELGIYVASSTSQERSFQLLPSLDGSVLVIHDAVYPDAGDADILVQRVSRYGELLFEDGQRSRPVCITNRRETGAVAVADGSGGAIIVYEIHLEGDDMDVMAQRVDAEGRTQWMETGTVVSSARVEESNPSIVSDGTGGAIVAMEMHFEDGDVDLKAQRILPDGKLGWLEGMRSADVATSPVAERNPRLVTDGDGGAIVIYEAEVRPGTWALLAQRVTRHGELAWNEGLRGVLVTSLPTDGAPKSVAVIPDGLGGAFVAFEVRSVPEQPEDVDLAVQHISAAGELLWGEPATEDAAAPDPVLAASSSWPERSPVLLADGQGGLVLAFESGSEQGDLDILAQRVDAEGRLRWNEGQRSAPVGLTFLSERRPRIVERQRESILIVFEMERENGKTAIACQSLSLRTGEALYSGGRFPTILMNPADMELNYLLEAGR